MYRRHVRVDAERSDEFSRFVADEKRRGTYEPSLASVVVIGEYVVRFVRSHRLVDEVLEGVADSSPRHAVVFDVNHRVRGRREIVEHHFAVGSERAGDEAGDADVGQKTRIGHAEENRRRL